MKNKLLRKYSIINKRLKYSILLLYQVIRLMCLQI